MKVVVDKHPVEGCIEAELARLLGAQYVFCFVCLHPDSIGYSLVTHAELQDLIRTKRTQYQINL